MRYISAFSVWSAVMQQAPQTPHTLKLALRLMVRHVFETDCLPGCIARQGHIAASGSLSAGRSSPPAVCQATGCAHRRHCDACSLQSLLACELHAVFSLSESGTSSCICSLCACDGQSKASKCLTHSDCHQSTPHGATRGGPRGIASGRRTLTLTLKHHHGRVRACCPVSERVASEAGDPTVTHLDGQWLRQLGLREVARRGPQRRGPRQHLEHRHGRGALAGARGRRQARAARLAALQRYRRDPLRSQRALCCMASRRCASAVVTTSASLALFKLCLLNGARFL